MANHGKVGQDSAKQGMGAGCGIANTNPVFDGVGLRLLRAGKMPFVGLVALSFFVFNYFQFSSFLL